MMKNILPLIIITLTISCSTYNRSPSSVPEIITSKKLAQMRPLEVVQLLKDNCCNGIVFEPTEVSFWNKNDIQDLETYLGDNTPSAPSVSSYSSIMCNRKRYISTVDREAKHLILAIKMGKYPQALCSTYDLKLE
jgi:hypothetical protein